MRTVGFLRNHSRSKTIRSVLLFLFLKAIRTYDQCIPGPRMDHGQNTALVVQSDVLMKSTLRRIDEYRADTLRNCRLPCVQSPGDRIEIMKRSGEWSVVDSNRLLQPLSSGVVA
jgi:hypothetical protein